MHRLKFFPSSKFKEISKPVKTRLKITPRFVWINDISQMNDLNNSFYSNE